MTTTVKVMVLAVGNGSDGDDDDDGGGGGGGGGGDDGSGGCGGDYKITSQQVFAHTAQTTTYVPCPFFAAYKPLTSGAMVLSDPSTVICAPASRRACKVHHHAHRHGADDADGEKHNVTAPAAAAAARNQG